MQTLVPLLIGNTVVALALALVAWLCGRWGRPALAHVVWVLVIVKLVTPPVWRVEVTEARETEPAPVVAMVAIAKHDVETPSPAKPQAAGVGVIERASIQSPAPQPAPWLSLTWYQLVLALWTAGSFAVLFVATYRIIRFRRTLRKASPAHSALLKEIEILAARVGLMRPPRVCVVDDSVSPMLWFVGGAPRLILPRELLDRMTAHQRAGVIAHELAHLKRRDHWVRLLELPATVLLWWHPLVWVARRGLREAEEVCCDAWAVSVVPEDGRRSYADALVDALEMIGRPGLPVGATGLGQLGSLRRRLAMIVTQSPPKSVSLAGRALLAVLFGAVLIMPVRGQARNAREIDGEAVAAVAATSAVIVDDTTRQAVLALLEAAQDRDPNVSQAAHGALFQFGASAVPVLIESLKDPRTSHVAIMLLAQQGSAAVDALVAALGSRDPVVRGHALQALDFMVAGGQSGFMVMEDPAMMGMEGGTFTGYGGMGLSRTPHGVEIAPRLIGPVSKVARDSEPTVRRAAVQLLFKIASVKPDEALVAPLLASLKDEDTQVRMYAAHGLGRLGAMAAGAVDALASAVGERDMSLRLSALDALASMGPNAKGAMGTVVGALKAPEPQIRSAAAKALGAMQQTPHPTHGGLFIDENVVMPGGFGPGGHAGEPPASAPPAEQQTPAR